MSGSPGFVFTEASRKTARWIREIDSICAALQAQLAHDGDLLQPQAFSFDHAILTLGDLPLRLCSITIQTGEDYGLLGSAHRLSGGIACRRLHVQPLRGTCGRGDLGRRQISPRPRQGDGADGVAAESRHLRPDRCQLRLGLALLIFKLALDLIET